MLIYAAFNFTVLQSCSYVIEQWSCRLLVLGAQFHESQSVDILTLLMLETEYASPGGLTH